MRILLVEDDQALGSTLESRLKKEGYEVKWAQTLAEAKTLFLDSPFQVAILDVGLPDGSGFELARWIKSEEKIPRNQRSNCGLLFMTALNTAENRLEGYEIGADEFIPKPFHLRELFLRLKHVVENHQPALLISIGSDLGFRLINLDEGSVADIERHKQFLSAREHKILSYLIERSPSVVSRDQLLDLIVGEDQFPTHRTIDNSIVKLRQILSDKDGSYIRSVRGVGYQWILEINKG